MGNSLNRDEFTGQRANAEPWTRATGRELLGGSSWETRREGIFEMGEEAWAGGQRNAAAATEVQTSSRQVDLPGRGGFTLQRTLGNVFSKMRHFWLSHWAWRLYCVYWIGASGVF